LWPVALFDWRVSFLERKICGQMKPEKIRIFKLEGKVQHYVWGGTSFLPQLLDVPNPGMQPFAEYWMGAHSQSPSEIVFNDRKFIPLDRFIESSTAETLGPEVAKRFGRLPYLFKVQDVKDMLSIQVHPSKQDAEMSYDLENKKGVPLNAHDRNYKDDNHKPEIAAAVSEFWLLHGFQPPDPLKKTLRDVPEMNFLLPVFDKGDYQALYQHVMQMSQSQVNSSLQPLLDRIVPLYQSNKLEKKDPHFWAARAADLFCTKKAIDRGIFSVYLFNLVNLHPGEAIFQDAGVPHAYLEGQCVELMANSDNVLRGGLTVKHVDVAELMKNIRFQETVPKIIHEKKIGTHEGVYPSPAADFELGRIMLDTGERLSLYSSSAEILFVLMGSVTVHENGQDAFARKSGEAFVGFSKAKFQVSAKEPTMIYRAGVPAVAEIQLQAT
jgi:mannose-6-phosphate isomerase